MSSVSDAATMIAFRITASYAASTPQNIRLILLRDLSKVKDLLATRRCYSIRGLLMI